MPKNLQIKTLSEWEEYNERPFVIAGPCSAESEKQVMETAIGLKKIGKTDMLRVGIWKPRTRPNSFEGVGSKGLPWLKKAKKETGLPLTIEVANATHVYEALKFCGSVHGLRPILLPYRRLPMRWKAPMWAFLSKTR